MTSLIPEVNQTCLDLLLLEMVPTAIRVTKDLESENVLTREQMDENGESIKNLKISDGDKIKLSEEDRAGSIDLISNSENLNNEDVIYRVESYGFNIGLRFGELLNYKLNNDDEIYGTGSGKQTFKLNTDILNIMKFICRDIWKNLYGKQMDNLRTNHRGSFVLIDNHFKGIQNMDSAQGREVTVESAKAYLWFPSGIIRGILSSLGVNSSVHADINEFPSVQFTIQTNIQR